MDVAARRSAQTPGVVWLGPGTGASSGWRSAGLGLPTAPATQTPAAGPSQGPACRGAAGLAAGPRPRCCSGCC